MTKYYYDEFDQLARVVDAAGKISQFDYNKGRLIQVQDIKNTPGSVHQRLLHKTKESSRPFNELLQRFAIERFMYRLSKSPQAGQAYRCAKNL